MNKKETALLSVPRGESPETTRFLQRVKQVIDYIAANAGTGDGNGSTTLSKGAFVKLYKEVAQGGFIPPPYEELEFIEGLLDALNGKITNSQLHKDLGATIAKIDKNETAISIETQERIADILAATEAINGNRAAIIQESTTRSTEFEAVNTQLGVLVTKTDDNTASIVAERLARTTADSAQVSRLDALDVITADGSARIGTLETAVVENKTAITTAKTELRAEFDSTINGVGPDSITNRIEKNRAAIQLESETRAGEISAYAAQQATIQTTVNGHTASIQEIRQSVDGSLASWQIRADVNGLIGGIGFSNNGATVDFIIRASTFAIAGPSGSTSTPFTVVPNDMTVNGVLVKAGSYLTTAYIQDGSITNAKIGNASVDTLQIKGDAVTVPRVDYYGMRQEFNLVETEQLMHSITMDAAGGSVSVTLGIESLYVRSRGNDLLIEQYARVLIRVRRNDVLLRTLTLKRTDFATKQTIDQGQVVDTIDYYIVRYDDFVSFPTLIDRPPPGDNVYTVTVEGLSLDSGHSKGSVTERPISIESRSLCLIGAKR